MKTLKGKTNIIIISIMLIIIVITIVTNGAEIKKNETEYSYALSAFRYFKLGMNEEKYFSNPVMQITTRRADLASPGDYIHQPGMQPSAIDSADIEFIKSAIKPYLADNYYDDKILDYVNNFDGTPLNRKEFYFNFYSDSVFMITSGWYNKFAHIIVFTEFDSKQTFIENAQHYFKLPSIDIKNVEYDEYKYPYSDINDYFYSYVDDKNKFKISGYPVTQWREEPEHEGIDYKFTVIDLTIYTDEE